MSSVGKHLLPITIFCGLILIKSHSLSILLFLPFALNLSLSSRPSIIRLSNALHMRNLIRTSIQSLGKIRHKKSPFKKVGGSCPPL